MDSTGTILAGKSMEERWAEEAAFFDTAAKEVKRASLALDPLAVTRYSGPRFKRHFNKEFRFQLLGGLEGRRVLDVGCGDGLNSVMLARLGARVTGIDLSARMLEHARHRAELNGVANRVEFLCTPIETAALPDDSFDIVWGDAILHHVLDVLELVMRRLSRAAKPGGLLVFAEPINLFEPLRRLRRMIPVRTNGTPGERPLVQAEIDIVGRYVSNLQIRHYGLLGRLDRYILENFNYERSSPARRGTWSCVNRLDYFLLSLPLVKSLAGTCVMYGAPAKGSQDSEAAA